jgi:hypothetical protein
MKTTKLLPSLLTVLTIILSVTACNTKNDDPPYVEAVLDFNIVLPEGWQYIKDYLVTPFVYQAWSPNEFAGDVDEDMWVVKFDADTYTDLADFYTQQFNYIKTLTGYSFIWSNDTTINGEPGKKFIHKQRSNLQTSSGGDYYNLICEKYFFIHNSYPFLVNFNALDTTYYRFKPVFQDIISSFSFK